MDNPDDRIDLLLAAADDGRPVLEDGLPGEAAQGAPPPKKAKNVDEKGGLEDHSADLNGLPKQKWAVIAVEGREGDKQIEQIRALIELREREQGAPAQIYRVRSEMSAKDALDWKNALY